MFITLEKASKEVISDIKKLEIFDSKIFILDRNSNKSIYVFSLTGSFLYKFGSEPSDSIYGIRNFQIRNGKVIIYRDNIGVVFFYSPDGRELKKIMLGFNGTDLLTLDENNFVFYSRGIPIRNNNLSYSLFYFDSSGNHLAKSLPIDKNVTGYSHKSETVFHTINGSNYFLPSLQNSLLKVEKDRLINHMQFNFYRANIPKQVLSKTINPSNIHSFPFVTEINGFWENQKYIQVQFAFGGNLGYALYSKLNNKVITSGIGVFADEKTNYFSPIPISVHREYFITPIYPEQIIKVFTEVKSKGLLKSINTPKKVHLDNNTNPILMFYTIATK
jgi:hypothetical protein